MEDADRDNTSTATENIIWRSKDFGWVAQSYNGCLLVSWTNMSFKKKSNQRQLNQPAPGLPTLSQSVALDTK